jgi:prophage maintenance system killer protein
MAKHDIAEVIIYKAKDVKSNLEVNLRDETVWLSQKQMAQLFGKNVMTINEHIRNVYKEGELKRKPTIRKFLIVQKEGKRQVTREVECYNLDVIISVGYRVKSKQGTRFRIWATNLLKQHLVKGYTLNQARLKELQQTVNIISKVATAKNLSGDEATGLLKVITDYSYALDVLDKYDLQQLEISHTSKREIFRIEYDEAISAIRELKRKFKASELFGHEKDNSFKSSLNNIYQTFDKKELYPSIEEKAANLLYFIIKNHSFSDGNKRIAAFIFIWFLERNHLLYHADGTKRIADNAIVALCLMIAESGAEEKDAIVKVIVNLINRNN